MFNIFKKAPVEKLMLLQHHQEREAKWNQFIQNCERFEYVCFKNGCAFGYKKGEDRDKIYSGTQLIIPFEMVTVYVERY